MESENQNVKNGNGKVKNKNPKAKWWSENQNVKNENGKVKKKKDRNLNRKAKAKSCYWLHCIQATIFKSLK